jgi:hypothetical protein
MNKLQKTLAVLISSALMALPAAAVEFRVGISAGLAGIESTGTETLKDSSNKTAHAEDATAVIPSWFTELATDSGLGIGYDSVSGSADLAGGVRKTVNVSTEQAAAVVGNDAGTQQANAEVDGMSTIYLIKKFESGLLFKFGTTSADVNTIETLASGTTYGNKTVDGTMVGIGWETANDSGIFVRTTFESTSFDSVKLTGTEEGGTSGSYNIIDADVDMQMAKISIGKIF